MIKANKGHLEVSGYNDDIIFELNLIFDALIVRQPELLIAVMTAWSSTLLEVTKNLTPEQQLHRKLILDACLDYIKICKGESIDGE